MLVVAALFSLRSHHAAITVTAVALYVIISGLFIPKLFLATQRAFRVFGRWVGAALTWLLLVPFFVLVFIPGRLVLMLSRKDPLTRRFPGDGMTSWHTHQVRADKSHYRKQYK